MPPTPPSIVHPSVPPAAILSPLSPVLRTLVTMPPYRYIEAHELARIIKSGAAAGKEYQVVDVRDQDFAGGNIPGAINAPSEERTEQSVQDLVISLQGVPRVVFHCALSQARGPKAARIYAAELERQGALLPLIPAPSPSPALSPAPSSALAPSPSSSFDAATASAEDAKTFSPNPFAAKKEVQEVLVLREGFTGWQALYRNDPLLVEQFDPAVWGSYAH